LTDIRDSPHFQLFPVGGEDFDAITAAFDRAEAFLERRLPAASAWMARGLDVAFDPESRQEYAEAVAADALEDLIERNRYIADRIANFE
jgi:hypothetical protein